MIARVKVLQSRRLTPTTHAIRIERPRGFEFRPVQFVGLEIETDEGSVEYPMSMASSPTRDWIEFGARVASGSPWKRAFAALRPGDTVEIDGPYGRFVLDETRPAVFVAGGIGITPLKGMMEYATDKALPLDITLLYSNRTPEEIAFREEIDALAARNPRLRVVHTLTRAAAGWAGRVGRIDEALLREAAKGLRDPAFYVCGLPAMVEDMERHLAAMGVPPARVVSEEFYGYG